MKCPNCGDEVREKDRFCEKCGTALVRKKMISNKKSLAMASVVGVFLLGFWLIAPGISTQRTFINTIGMEFVLIPAGEFDMGSPSSEVGRDVDEGPVHNVKLAKSFYIGKYEVTQKQWHDVMGTDPSNFKTDDLPIEKPAHKICKYEIT